MRFKRFTVLLTIVLLFISSLWAYRVRAVTEADEFAPASRNAMTLPAGTVLHAVIRSGIASIAHAGDTITAFVLTPVTVNGELVVPPEAEIKGTLESLSLHHRHATATLDWTALVLRGRTVQIRTDKVVLKTIARTETDIMAGGLESLLGASFGVSVAAKAGDRRLITRGLLEGERNSVSTDSEVPVNVVLNHALTL